MVKALHQAGIEVILDVVFNHTGEGNDDGPTISFRGLDNSIYYMLDAGRQQSTTTSRGCGNTFNCNHPLVREASSSTACASGSREMHVDGFRFDLASILGRGPQRPADERPTGARGTSADDRMLAETKLIAEAWDAGGLYQVGYVPGFGAGRSGTAATATTSAASCSGDTGSIGEVATRICGSADLYEARRPSCRSLSINFITCHDGFTLNDLVTYNGKHNEANGEENRDGTDDNLSWNCGEEGPTDDPAIEALRDRQIKNFLTMLMLSPGRADAASWATSAGRTQQGNNNAYCQDNEISWVDWALAGENAGPASGSPASSSRSASITRRCADPDFRGRSDERGRDITLARLPPPVAWVGRPGVAGPRLHDRRLPEPERRPVE